MRWTTLLKGSWAGSAWLRRYKAPKWSTRNWNSGFRHSVQSGTKQCEVLFLKFNLNIQTSSKSDETCLVVSSIQCTPTHIKELNWATIWIWKIKMSQHVNSLLPIRDLERFMRRKQHCIQTWGHYLSHLGVESGLGPKIKFVLPKQNCNFYLRSNSMQALQIVGQHRLKAYHEKRQF